MKILYETRKEDQLYFQGPFWIIADSFIDIHRNKFSLECKKVLSDYEGNIVDDTSKNSVTHKNWWKNNLQDKYNQDFDYYPRGRVAIYNGIAFIHINSKCNINFVIDKIVNEYELSGLEIEVECNDEYQGSHYDFRLR